MSDEKMRVWWKKRISNFAVTVVWLLSLTVLAATFWQLSAIAEQRLVDARRLFFSSIPHSQSDIVIISITESTLSRFPYRSPVDRAFLAQILKQTMDRGAKAVGLDILLDQPTEPEKDKILKNTISHSNVPLAISYVDGEGLLTARQKSYLSEFVPPKFRGSTDIEHDPVDGIDRRFVPIFSDQSGAQHFSFSGLLAHEVGVVVNPDPVAIDWSREADPFIEIPAQILEANPTLSFKNKIVLIGLDTPFDDRHRIPFGSTLGIDSVPGVSVQAQALVSLLDDPKSPGENRWISLCLAVIGIGVGFGLTQSRKKNSSLLMKTTLLLAVIFGYFIFSFFVWYAVRIMLPIVLPLLTAVLGFWIAPIVRSFRANATSLVTS